MKYKLPDSITVEFVLTKTCEDVSVGIDENGDEVVELEIEYEIQEVTDAGYESAVVRALVNVDVFDELELSDKGKKDLLTAIISDNFKEDVIQAIVKSLSLITSDTSSLN